MIKLSKNFFTICYKSWIFVYEIYTGQLDLYKDNFKTKVVSGIPFKTKATDFAFRMHVKRYVEANLCTTS